MTFALPARHKKYTVVYLIIILALLQLFIALLTDGFSMSGDEAIWHYIGRNWFRNGLIPYTGGIDNKSPLYYAIYGLSDKLFGVNYWFPRVLGTMVQSVGIWFLYKIAKQQASHQAGILAICIYGLSVLWKTVDGKFVSYDETYDVTLIITAFYIFLNAANKKSFFISGFLAGLAISFRLTAAFGCLPLLILSFRKQGFATLFFCLGGVCAMALVLLIIKLCGINLYDWYRYGFADNFGSGSTTDHNIVWRLLQFYNMFFFSEVILFYPFVLAYLFITKKVNWLMLWLASVFLVINLVGNYARVDLKELLPPLSLAAGISIAHFIEVSGFSMGRAMVIVWICFIPKSLESIFVLVLDESVHPELYCKEPYVQPDDKAIKRLGTWIKQNTSPKDLVFVAGFGGEVQTYSERLSPSVYFNVTQTTIAKARFYKDMQQNKPVMILVPLFSSYKQYVSADLRDFVDQYVKKDYHQQGCMYSYSIYRLNK